MTLELSLKKIAKIDLEACVVMCSNCGALWKSSFSCDGFDCLKCENRIVPEKDVVLDLAEDMH